MEAQLQNLQIAIFAGLIVIIGAGALFIKSYLELRTKHMALELKVKETSLDDTAMRNKISVEAQTIIQRLYVDREERLKLVESDLRSYRDMLDDASSERAKLEAQKDELEKQLNSVLAQQLENVKKLAAMEPLAEKLKEVEAENANLKGQVADLRQKVEDADARAEQRHADMNRVTGANAELTAKLRQAELDLSNAQQLLRECKDRVAHYELKYPDLNPAITGTGDAPVTIS